MIEIVVPKRDYRELQQKQTKKLNSTSK